ncbi:P-loop containing nucleoside triphosphate hydrolase protein [Mycena floridula]|nr:P-loop containing nucleoside triphosphate hydrolase protein [Mycena floridula]
MAAHCSSPSDSVHPSSSEPSSDPVTSSPSDCVDIPQEFPLDYNERRFEWDHECRAALKSIFNLDSFRGCQLGAVNAVMDGRNVICVMPTGGGKSLTYQLPAVISSGVTVVISPLKSLISDQLMHLERLQVNAVKLTGELNVQELEKVEARLRSNINVAPKARIKLCYCTPEKLALHWNLIENMITNHGLVRFVIDEAHYFIQTDATFRSNFRGVLQALHQRFPWIPITAVTATCPPDVLRDLIITLGLEPAVSGSEANLDGTVYFSAPMHRPNLHYDIVPKHSDQSLVYQWITGYILEHHKDRSGIVYCQTRKDAEEMARQLSIMSNEKIQTAFYHGKKSDLQRDTIYQQWRAGTIKVVCATESSFGLGINKNDVRFVLYDSIPKSVDSFYQGSGRAGRDGKDASCVMLYRPQDIMTMIAIAIRTQDGKCKVDTVLKDLISITRFTQSTECRNVWFARHLSQSLQPLGYPVEEEPCEHCDNCSLKKSEGLLEKDLCFEAWQVLKLMEQVEAIYNNKNITLHMLIKLARGVKTSQDCKFKVDRLKFDQIGGKVALNAQVCSRTKTRAIFYSTQCSNWHC